LLIFLQLITLWHWLPERMTMADPELIYSSNEHGISLTTFYTRSEKYEPTILLIKTTEGEVIHLKKLNIFCKLDDTGKWSF